MTVSVEYSPQRMQLHVCIIVNLRTAKLRSSPPGQAELHSRTPSQNRKEVPSASLPLYSDCYFPFLICPLFQCPHYASPRGVRTVALFPVNSVSLPTPPLPVEWVYSDEGLTHPGLWKHCSSGVSVRFQSRVLVYMTREKSIRVSGLENSFKLFQRTRR